MKKEDIWELRPEKKDRVNAAEFAATTLAWTFNRMSYNTTIKGQKNRALNIVKGILAQEMLRQKLKKQGVKVKTDNSFRTSDIFDFLIIDNGREVKIDLKTNHHYNDYNNTGRERLTKDFIIKNAEYSGPDWRYFFPMLMPHNQIEQNKDVYCFGMSSSVDFRYDIYKDRDDFFIAAFPYGEYLNFYSNKKLCRKREENQAGFYLKVSYFNESIFEENIDFEIIGEWNGKIRIEHISLKPNSSPIEIGPFSIISSFRVFEEDWNNFEGTIEIKISKNELDEEVLNSKKEDINIPPRELFLTKDNFCNLILPVNYVMYLFGWITKTDFLSVCRNYTAWVWPKDSVNKYCNQPWTQITESDLKTITGLGFDDCIIKKPTRFNAGWMKTNGRGGGACCYVFPNIGRNGGVMETNLYVLLSDLKELPLLFKTETAR